MRFTLRTVTPLVLGATLLVVAAGCETLLGSSGGPRSKLIVPVTHPPPPPKKENTPGTVKPGYVWVPGHWEWVAGTYRWREGRFLRARRNREFVRAKYVKKNGQWYYIKPHWRKRRKVARPPRPRQVRPVSRVAASTPPEKKAPPQKKPPAEKKGGPESAVSSPPQKKKSEPSPTPANESNVPRKTPVR
jgi:hypothetical protein